MSDVTRLKEQLFGVANSASQASGGLAGFQRNFQQQQAVVQSLIEGSSTGADRDIALVLDSAAQSVGVAIEALAIAADTCKRYAEQI